MAANLKTKADIQKELDATKKELETFKKKVLDKAISMQDEYGYCDGGLNDFLETVGLEAPGTDWTFCVSFQVNTPDSNDLSSSEVVKAFTSALETLAVKNTKIKGIEETKSTGYPDYRHIPTGVRTFSVVVDEVYES